MRTRHDRETAYTPDRAVHHRQASESETSLTGLRSTDKPDRTLKHRHNIDILENLRHSRIDTGDDNRVSKEEFCAENVKAAVEKWTGETLEDMEAEFDNIDENGGGQILFGEFVKWALDRNLDIEDDVDEAVSPE